MYFRHLYFNATLLNGEGFCQVILDNIVQGQSSICKMQNRGTKREVIRLDDKGLCQHLQKLHVFFCASEDSYLEDVERTDNGFLPDENVTRFS